MLIFGIIKLVFRDKTDIVFENFTLCYQLSRLKIKKNQTKKPCLEQRNYLIGHKPSNRMHRCTTVTFKPTRVH